MPADCCILLYLNFATIENDINNQKKGTHDETNHHMRSHTVSIDSVFI